MNQADPGQPVALCPAVASARGREHRPLRPTLIFATMTLLLTGSWRLHSSAQRVSPHETATYQIGRATVELTYGRPATRGRVIFGALVPFERVWMPGADEATILKTDAGLQFAKAYVPAGSYSLYTIPSPNAWKLIINKQTGQWHTVYSGDQDLTRIDMRVESLSQPVERLTISAIPRGEQGGDLRIEWAAIRAVAPFTVPH